jgi:hypothetical protein
MFSPAIGRRKKKNADWLFSKKEMRYPHPPPFGFSDFSPTASLFMIFGVIKTMS